jgi:SAM-dependent methyltransferase
MSSSTLSDAWERGDPYEQYVGRWSRQVAPRFIEWLDIPAGRRWVDIGCGTGALCAAILQAAATAGLTGIDPSRGFLATAQRQLGGRADLLVGSATAIPLADASADVIVSGLMLNFVAEPGAALAEMARVTGPGGVIAAYVWDYAAGMAMMRHFWDAAVAIDAQAMALDEGRRFPLCRPDALRALFDAAGLQAVEMMAIDIDTSFADFDDYWQPFLGGQGPAPAYAMSLDEAARERLRERVRSGLPIAPGGEIELRARAWAVRGTVAGRARS